MKLLPKINSKVFGLLAFTPLQYMLKALEAAPETGMVYADDEEAPSVCVVRVGPLVFTGGNVSPGCLEYLKTKILTFEIYEKYGVFYFFYPNEAWGETLTALFPGHAKIKRRVLYGAENHTAYIETPPAVVPITAELMKSETKNLEMITNEVTTYKSFDRFLENGIGYTLLIDGEIRGFCTSEYQSEKELAVGIEVAEPYRKKGYARAMTGAFLEKAGARGFKVYWESWADNKASVNTALSSGFHHIADYPIVFLDLRDLSRSERAPGEGAVLNALRKHLPGVKTVSRVPRGASTYVYRAEAAGGIYYARFLPEADNDFAPEVTAHRMMSERGIPVPVIAAFERREEQSGLSMMLAGEVPGVSMEERWPEQGAAAILREAGRLLAGVHTIPVDGFGWIDRKGRGTLKAEKSSFAEYFEEYLEDDLTTLLYYDFTPGERELIRKLMKEARSALDVKDAVLVHGDFDISHIFYSSDKFSGFIDFGEIRGNNRLFDLATFALYDSSPGRSAYLHLLEGYREAASLTADDLRAIQLMALFIVLRFAGKKAETKSRRHWYRLLKRQLELF